MFRSSGRKPADEMLAGAKIRYRLNVSNNLREGSIITCTDDYAHIVDTRSKQVLWAHKSWIIFDNIPNTGITMPPTEEIKFVGPVQTGQLRSDHLETQLHELTEVQKEALRQKGHIHLQQEQRFMERANRDKLPLAGLPVSSPAYRLEEIGTHPPSNEFYSPAVPNTISVHATATSTQKSSKRRQRTRRRGSRLQQQVFANPAEVEVPIRAGFAQPYHGGSSGYYASGYGGNYFHDDAGRLYFQQDSGLTFLVDGDVFYVVNPRKKKKEKKKERSRQHATQRLPVYDARVGVDPRLVPELFEGWTDSRGVWYPRTTNAPKEASFHTPTPPTPLRRRPPKVQVKPPDNNPFILRDKSMEQRVQAQLEHYFSEGNLETDNYMKSLMSDRGYVEASVISAFHRMKHHQVSVGLIVQSAQHSKLLKVKGTRIRARDGWWMHTKEPVLEEGRADSLSDPSTSDEAAPLQQLFTEQDEKGFETVRIGKCAVEEVKESEERCDQVGVLYIPPGDVREEVLVDGSVESLKDAAIEAADHDERKYDVAEVNVAVDVHSSI